MQTGSEGSHVGGNEGGGGDQADRGLGGLTTHSVKTVNSGLNKCYKNTIRLELNRVPAHQKVNHSVICDSFSSRFGPHSKQVQEIIAIGQGSDDLTWFIAYKGSIPDSTINSNHQTVNDAYVIINNVRAYLFNASESIESTTVNSNNHNKINNSNRFQLSFRVHGLPLDVKQCEVFEVLKKIGHGIENKEDLRQVCIKDSMIRTEMVDFKINCNKENEQLSVARVEEQTSFIGNHEVIIGEYKYPIKVICFGFCNVCKKSGHKSYDCEVRKKQRVERLKNVECNLCKEMGHYSKGCPNKDKILEKRLASTRCHKCRELGHLSNTCVYEGPTWIINTPVIDEIKSTDKLIINDILQPNNDNNISNHANNNIVIATSTPSKIEDDEINEQDSKINNMMAKLVTAESALKRVREDGSTLSFSSGVINNNNKLRKQEDNTMDDADSLNESSEKSNIE